MQKPELDEYAANTVYYSETSILRFTLVVGTILACLLPVASVVLLYLVKDMSTRLGIIAAFTAAFSMALCLVTSARTVDIFTATAA